MRLRRSSSDRGATLVEYAVLVAVIVVPVVPALAFLEGGLGTAFETQAAAMTSDADVPGPVDGSTTTTSTTTTTTTTAPPALNAAFDVECVDLTCTFTDRTTATGTVQSWAWDFGDGQTSTAQNPSRTYASSGTYSVTLTVGDDAGASGSVAKAATPVAPNQSPVAAFTASCTYLSCTFTSTSTDADGSIVGSSWTFGDGGSGAGTTASRMYAGAGSNVVRLTVTDDRGATAVAEKTLTVTRPKVQASVTTPAPRVAGGNRFYRATVSLTSQDGSAPSGVAVRGTWTGDPTVVTCTTDATGACTTADWKSGTGVKTFTVDSVDHAGWDGVKATGSVTG